MSSNNSDLLIAAGLVVAAVMYSRKTAMPINQRPPGTTGNLNSLPGNIGTGIGQALGGALGGWLTGLMKGGGGAAGAGANSGYYGSGSSTSTPSASWELGSTDLAGDLDTSGWA